MGPGTMILVFWMLSFKPTFSKNMHLQTNVFRLEATKLSILIFKSDTGSIFSVLVFNSGSLCTECFEDQSVQFSWVQSLSCVRLFATPWVAARQASLSITNSQNLLRLTSIESVMPSSHLILCHPLLLLPPIPPSIRVFSNESPLRMRWPKYWSFSCSIIPSKEIPGLIFRMTGWISLQSKGLSRVFSNTTVQKHQFFGTQPSSQSNSHIHIWPQEKP